MAGPTSTFSYMCSPYQTFLSLQSAASSIKKNITDTSSSLWSATTSKTRNTIDSSFQVLTTTRDSINGKIESTKNNFSQLKNKILATDKTGLAVTVGCTAASALLLNYYRPDQTLLYAASYLIKPSLYAAGAAAFTVCNAYGKGVPLNEAVKRPIQLVYRGGETIVHHYAQYAKAAPRAEAEGAPSSGMSMTKKAKEIGSRLLTENMHAFTGAKKLFLEAGGRAEALLIGIGVNQSMMLLEDTGYIINPGLASAALSTGLAATATLATVIYYTDAPLRSPSENLVASSEKALEKEEDPIALVSLDNLPNQQESA